MFTRNIHLSHNLTISTISHCLSPPILHLILFPSRDISHYLSHAISHTISLLTATAYLESNGGRSDVQHYAIVITDGNSNIEQERTIPAAIEARQVSFSLFAVKRVHKQIYSYAAQNSLFTSLCISYLILVLYK